MDLIEFRAELLYLGMSLPFTVRDDAGRILLAKGQKIETALQLSGIQSRPKIFVEIDATDEGVRALMSGISELNRAGAPIKDFSKYLHVRLATKSGDKAVASLSQRWGDVESKLGGLLGSAQTTGDFQNKLYILDQVIAKLLSQDSGGSLFLLFNRAVTHFGGYSAMHSLLCAVLVHSLAASFLLSDAERRSLVCAALTMNVAMTQLQDNLALQTYAPSRVQRSMIDAHSTQGRQILEQSGVLDSLWLQVVEHHHTTQTGVEKLVDWPVAARMTRILQTVDRYTAAMSPRKSRAGQTARDSVRSVVLPVGETKHDAVGTALVAMLGLSPPGTFVMLANAETSVVVRRGVKPGEPWVASVLNRLGEPIAEPRLRDTSKAEFSVQSTLTATSVKVSLNLELMLKQIPRGRWPEA